MSGSVSGTGTLSKGMLLGILNGAALAQAQAKEDMANNNNNNNGNNNEIDSFDMSLVNSEDMSEFEDVCRVIARDVDSERENDNSDDSDSDEDDDEDDEE